MPARLSWLPSLPAVAATLLCLAALSGCGRLPWSQADLTAAACPAAVVMRPLAGTALFDKPGMAMRPTDVVYYGILSEIDAKCAVSGNSLQTSLDIVIAAERGPSTKADSADFTYFLAVVGPNDSIISKNSYGVRVTVAQNAKRGAVNDHIDATIPLSGLAPSAMRIVVGFQQSPQTVDFYQHFRGR